MLPARCREREGGRRMGMLWIKKVWIVVLAVAVLGATGCAPRQMETLERSAASSPRSDKEDESSQSDEDPEEDPSSQEEEPKEDIRDTCQRLLSETSVFRMEDFASVDAILPDQYVTFYFMANYDGAEKLPIPEGFRQADGSLLLPGQDVEEFVTKYFAVEPETIRKASNWQEATTGYIVGGQGAAATSKAEISDVTQEGTAVTVTFDNYLDFTGTEQSDKGVVGPVTTRVLTLDLEEDGTAHFTSLKTTFQAEMDKLLAQ